MKALLLSLYLLITATTAIVEQPDNCASANCPTPLCANPVTPEGECCPSCENSQCKFKGCVQILGSSGSEIVTWKPDGCTTCLCIKEQTKCYTQTCTENPSLDPCIGRPTITSPTECCVTCDYGTPEDECVVVQDYNRYTYRLSNEDSGSSCSIALTFSRCDKRGYMDDSGQRFECNPVANEFPVKLSEDSPNLISGTCHALMLAELTYYDVVECVPVKSDYLNVGCDIYVE